MSSGRAQHNDLGWKVPDTGRVVWGQWAKTHCHFLIRVTWIFWLALTSSLIELISRRIFWVDVHIDL